MVAPEKFRILHQLNGAKYSFMDNKSDLDKQLNEALDMLDSGKDFIQIRKALEQKGLEKENIDYLIRLVDEFAIEERKVKEKINWSGKKMIFGFLFVVVAIVKACLFNDLGYLYTAYGLLVAIPMAIGLFLIWNGWSDLKKWKNYKPEIDDSKLKLKRRF